MSPAIRAATRRLTIWRPGSLLLIVLAATLTLAACTASVPTSSTQRSSTGSATGNTNAAPAAAKSSPVVANVANLPPSPTPAPLFSIVDPTLADATPWLSLRLSDGEPRIVSGWRLEVGSEAVTIPGNAIIQPGDMLILHVGDGRSSEREIYLGANSHALALAAAPGASVRLISSSGELIAQTTVPRY